MTNPQVELLCYEGREALYGGAAGGGKAQIMATPANAAKLGYNAEDLHEMESFRMRCGQNIITPFGPKLIDDAKIGDSICNPDGTTAKIILVHPVLQKECYRITFIDGVEIIAADDHLWSVKKSGKRNRIKVEDPYSYSESDSQQERFNKELLRRYKNITTKVLAELHWKAEIAKGSGSHWYSVPVCEPVNFQLPHGKTDMLPPYTLGVLIGDGSLTNDSTPQWSKPDSYIFESVMSELGSNGFTDVVLKRNYGDCIYSITGGQVLESLRSLKLSGLYSHEKFIPNQYKHANIEVRKKLLQGLMDTDGTVDKRGHCSFSSTSERLIEDVVYLARSLGYCATSTPKKAPGYIGKDGVKVICRPAWNVYITGRNRKELFLTPKKKNRVKELNHEGGRRIVKIEKLEGKFDTRCITVTHPNGLYLTNGFVVTHNSVALLAGALQFMQEPGYSAIILRRKFTQLSKSDSIMAKAREWLTSVSFRGVRPRWNGSEKKWTFPNGNTLEFGHMEHENNIEDYQGGIWPFIGVDEAGQFTDRMLSYPRTRQRKPPGTRLPMRWWGGANPGGVGHDYLKTRYIKDKDGNAVNRTDRAFFSAKLEDNPHIDRADYVKTLVESGIDPITLDQLLKGNWDAIAGGRFQKSWFANSHYKWIDERQQIIAYREGQIRWMFDPFKLSPSYRFMTIDPAASEKKTADFTVISVWCISPRTNDLVWIGCYRFQAEIPQVIEKIKMLVRFWRPGLVGIEAVAANNAVLKFCQQSTDPVMMTTALSPMGEDKLVRASLAIKIASDGRIWLPENPGKEFCYNEATTELFLFTGNDKVDAHDDVCLVPGTMIETERGQIPIESIQRGEKVWTREGLRTVKESMMTSRSKNVYEVKFSDGRSIRGTANHPVHVEGGGFIPIEMLKVGDLSFTFNRAFASVKSVHECGKSEVYNLEIEGENEYYANGILVHNCDTLSYAVNLLPQLSGGSGHVLTSDQNKNPASVLKDAIPGSVAGGLPGKRINR